MYLPATAYHSTPATNVLMDERKASTAGWWVEALSEWVRNCARTLLHRWMRDWRALLDGGQRHCPPSFECCTRCGTAALLHCWTTNWWTLLGGKQRHYGSAIVHAHYCTAGRQISELLDDGHRQRPPSLERARNYSRPDTAEMLDEHYWMVGRGNILLQ